MTYIRKFETKMQNGSMRYVDENYISHKVL